MTIYNGNALSRTNRIQNITTSPKVLQIRKGTGKKRISFGEMKTSGCDDAISPEELVSGINWRLTAFGKRQNLDATAVDDVSLADITKRAPNTCSFCREPIPAKETRYIRITVQIPSVGAEAEKCMLGSFCEECFNTGRKVPALPAEATRDAIDAKEDDWKRNLKPRQLEAWTRCKENGEKQATVAEKLGISQGDISKLVTAAAKIRDSYHANIS
ncbi:MAG: hypothetical protein ABSB65_16650 [Candidatus Acidiferrales bacterium]|jgi:hypothetical protein